MAPTTDELRRRAVVTSPQYDENQPETIDSDRKLVGIDGNWYDITNFIPHHPGGPLIEQFIGKDATSVFHAQGHSDVLKNRKPVGTYDATRTPVDQDFDRLKVKFTEMGFFQTTYSFYLKKALVVFCLLGAVFALVGLCEQWYLHYLGAVVLAFFFQQSAFLMHDFMHSQVVRTPGKDRLAKNQFFGIFFGTCCFGISSHWWMEEHIIHHAMTNTVDHPNDFVDPQMREMVWAQNKELFPFFSGLLTYYLIKIQYLTFVPSVVILGRLEIIIDSMRIERRWSEWFAFFIHWCWMAPLLSLLPSWRERIIFYAIAAIVEGWFHFQLILSHYCREFYGIQKFHDSSWYAVQILTNMNIDSPWWQDWYYGGLNYHIEHHLFPKMARNKLRHASPHIKEVCEKHGILYDSVPFSTALTRTLVHLKRTGDSYQLPEKK